MKKICKHCKKSEDEHQAITLNCPAGIKTRIGYIHFNSQSVFEWNDKKTKINKNYGKIKSR